MKFAPRFFKHGSAVILCTVLGATCGYATAPVDLYKLLMDAQISAKLADSKMLECMNEASDLLARFYRHYKKFPEDLAELESIDANSKLSRTKNPYFESELLARELPVSTSHVIQFEIVHDYGLSHNGIDATAKHPPKSWTGLAGSITIMHNSENVFAIRACGMDGKPITDSTTSSAIYIFKDLAQ
jgi:hypothetical protein